MISSNHLIMSQRTAEQAFIHNNLAKVIILMFLGHCLLTPVLATGRTPSTESLDQASDTLRQDDGRPAFVFRFPDAFGDDLRNQRFQARRTGVVSEVIFAFPTRAGVMWTTGDPKLVVKLWPMGADSLPVAGTEWISDTVDYSAYSSSLFNLDSAWRGTPDQFVSVDVSFHSLRIDSGQWFHVGYSIVRDSDDDSLAILSDDGNPATNYASEWYNGRFVQMREGWGGVNFFIRVILESETAIQNPGRDLFIPSVVLHPAYPNPFNTATRIAFDLSQSGEILISLFDLLGREVSGIAQGWWPAGHHEVLLDAHSLPSGLYLCRLEAVGISDAKQVVLIK